MKTLSVGAMAMLAAGCANYGNLDKIRTVQPTGASEFNQALTLEYRDLANFEEKEMYDWPDAVRWSEKGLAASRNELVLPEELSQWDLPSDKVPELTQARARLMTALDNTARTKAPVPAAQAQVLFDCWVEQQEENWQWNHIAACRDRFLQAMKEVDAAMAPKAAPAPQPAATPAPSGPYTVLFAFDSAQLTPDGLRMVRNAATAARNQNLPIGVIGHADASGPNDYNMRLSIRRAESVRDALVADGIAASRITTSGQGESDLAVPTPDGVREQANRRVVILFR
ncbi:OmpA family protein [Oceanibaculum pacificum]|nr:OmpA family protein [Oceanibaculum pacificum]